MKKNSIFPAQVFRREHSMGGCVCPSAGLSIGPFVPTVHNLFFLWAETETANDLSLASSLVRPHFSVQYISINPSIYLSIHPCLLLLFWWEAYCYFSIRKGEKWKNVPKDWNSGSLRHSWGAKQRVSGARCSILWSWHLHCSCSLTICKGAWVGSPYHCCWCGWH